MFCRPPGDAECAGPGTPAEKSSDLLSYLKLVRCIITFAAHQNGGVISSDNSGDEIAVHKHRNYFV